MAQNLYTLKEIAGILELPESTLRKYRDAYSRFMPFVGTGRDRRYRAQAIEVFKTIRECRTSLHLSWEDTENELEKKFPTSPDGERFTTEDEEDDMAFLVEKMREMSAKITGAGKHSEFLLMSIAAELFKLREAVEDKKQKPKTDAKPDTSGEDIKAVRTMTYTYNEVVQRQYKENNRATLSLLESLSSLQAAVAYIPKHIDKRIRALHEASKIIQPEQPQPTRVVYSTSNDEEVMKLKKDLNSALSELEKYRNLYFRAKKEIEQLRDAERKKMDRLFIEEKRSKDQKEYMIEDLTSDQGVLGGWLSKRRKK